MLYQKPNMEVLRLETEDVITGSTGNNGEVIPDITWPTN